MTVDELACELYAVLYRARYGSGDPTYPQPTNHTDEDRDLTTAARFLARRYMRPPGRSIVEMLKEWIHEDNVKRADQLKALRVDHYVGHALTAAQAVELYEIEHYLRGAP